VSWWQGFDQGAQRCRLELWEAGDRAWDGEAYSHKVQERTEHGFS
jgi:hypothetical protein